jgi:hypothetical protein
MSDNDDWNMGWNWGEEVMRLQREDRLDEVVPFLDAWLAQNTRRAKLRTCCLHVKHAITTGHNVVRTYVCCWCGATQKSPGMEGIEHGKHHPVLVFHLEHNACPERPPE